jgi:SEC-C motif.
MEDFYAKKCSCGAVTVDYINDEGEKISNSMPLKAFKEHFPGKKLENEQYYACNYCVNHWGIDLCNCGSGKKVGHCHEFRGCKNNIPAQEFDKPKTYALWN